MAVVSEDFIVQVERFVEAARREIAARPDEPPIRRTPGVCGGDARVRNTRIPVWTLISFCKLGASEPELLADYPSLTPADMDAVWAYYREHTAEVDAAIADQDAAMAGGETAA